MIRRIAYLILITVFAGQQGMAQTVVVTDDNSVTTGDASSVLDVKSTSKGFLAPRMTEAQRTAISGPATGLLVYQTNNTTGYYYFDGSAWITIAKGIGWTASGNNIYYNSGKVGIGNNSPAEALDVTGNIKLSGALMPNNDAGTSTYLLTSAGAGAAPTWSNPGTYFESYAWKLDGNSVPSLKKIGTTSNYDLPFITNNTEKMRLTSGGYLGIGVDSPAAPIHVGRTSPTSGITPIALFEETRDAGLSNSVVMMLGNKSISSNATKFLIGSTSSSKRWIMGTDKDGNNSQNFYLWDDNSVLARLFIDGSNGYTGLGTASPEALFHVFSHLPASFDVPAALYEGESDGGSVSLTLRNNSGARTKTSFIFGGSSSSYQWSLGNDVQGNNEHNFYIYDEASFNTRFFIDQSGNVGIGNILPSELLDVSGNIKFSGALMPNNEAGTAGYVLTSAGPGNPPTWELPAAGGGSGWELDGNTLSATKTLGTISAHDLPIITNNIERVRIKSDGKVGIGMNNPSEALDVTGNIKLSGNVSGGSWNGSIIGPMYGGTGVNNGTKTITLGGNLTTSGAFATTLTTTGTTNVTLPTTGTLVNTAVTTLSSLASIGTITTGTWNGTVINPTYGGTGINNGSRTITLGGNLTTSGAFNTTLTTTGTTNVTLPTSGTLVNSAVTTLSSLASIGTITTGTWNGTVINPTYGGTGVNNAANTITLGGNLTTSGAFATTLTTTGTTNVTLPTSGTLVNSAVTTLSSLASIGTITTGTWNGTVINPTYGGTGVNNGSNTITLGGNLTTSGAFPTTLTTTGTTNVTLPTTGTLVNTAVTTLSSLASIGTITTGTWNGTVVSPTYGGTGVDNGTNTITLSGNLTVGATSNISGNVTVASAKTLTANNSITLSGTDGTTVSLPTATGEIPIATAATTVGKITANATATKMFLSQTNSASSWTSDIDGTLIGVRQFTTAATNQTYTPTTGTHKIVVYLLGAGGGGGGVSGANNQCGAAGGGGGGAAVLVEIDNVTGTYTYTVGSGGAGGVAGANAGTPGGSTTFVNGSTTYTAPGGSGGAAMTTGTTPLNAAGGSGGVEGTNGDVNGSGENGDFGFRMAGTFGFSGGGASSAYGSGGKPVITTAAGGNAATGHGAGGSGALTLSNVNRAGGAGSEGLIIIYEYR